MKYLKKLIISLILMLPFYVYASGNVTLNKTSLTIEEGSSASFTITADNSAGKVIITSNDRSIATVNKSSEWIEKSSLSVKVTGVKVGTTSIKVEINAATFDEEPIKTVKNVSVTVTPKKSSNANLSDLKIDGQTISGFSSSKTSYSYNTESDSVKISATTDDSKASVSGTGTKTLKYGANKFTIKVKAENGSTKSYIVTVNKKDDRNSNNDLNSLSVSAGNLNFSKNTTSYSINVENDVKEINISATALDSKAKVSGTGTKTLKEGKNTFKVVVTAENEKTKTYTIVVNRKKTDTKEEDKEPVVVEKNKYTLSYDSEDFTYCDSFNSKEITKEEGDIWGTLCTPKKDGYEFIGWYTQKDGGEQITSSSSATKNIVVYARFNKIQESNNEPDKTIIIIASVLSFVIGFTISFLIFRNRN